MRPNGEYLVFVVSEDHVRDPPVGRRPFRYPSLLFIGVWRDWGVIPSPGAFASCLRCRYSKQVTRMGRQDVGGVADV